MSSYQDYISQLATRNPCLAALSSFMHGNIHLSRCKSTISIIEIDAHWKGSVHEATNIQDVALKLSSLQQRPRPDAGGMILIVEDPGAAEIETLGSLLDIDPIFFCGHITSSYQDVERNPSAPLLGLLPSRLISKDYVNIHYQRVLDLGLESDFHHSPYKMTIPGNNPRTIRRLPPLSGRQLGLARTCCSVLVKEFPNGAWTYFVLVDSTTSSIVFESKETDMGSQPTTEAPQTPRRIIPEDFRDLPVYSTFQTSTKDAVPRTASLRGDLLSLFQEPLPGISSHHHPNILSLTYYPLQIVLAEWMLYAQLMSRYVKFYEYSLEAVHTRRSESQDQLELHRWRRRSSQSLHKLRMTRQFVEYWHSQEASPPKLWDVHARSLEALNPILTSIVQLIDSHKSISEAADVKRLTYIAIVFIPLSFIAGLFSMVVVVAASSTPLVWRKLQGFMRTIHALWMRRVGGRPGLPEL
ncbi:hypothetical protein F4810DRAFT_702558 [Camillea tinctor]|nr:hypothetical protein F4810DRAFT_702558 [Camillea tinctor]